MDNVNLDENNSSPNARSGSDDSHAIYRTLPPEMIANIMSFLDVQSFANLIASNSHLSYLKMFTSA